MAQLHVMLGCIEIMRSGQCGQAPHGAAAEFSLSGAGLMSSRAPLIPSNCEPEWGHLLERCWEPIPMNRCSLRDLAESLQRIIDEIEVEAAGEYPLLQPMRSLQASCA